MLGTRPLSTDACVDQPITGLPHSCIMYEVGRGMVYVKMPPGVAH